MKKEFEEIAGMYPDLSTDEIEHLLGEEIQVMEPGLAAGDPEVMKERVEKLVKSVLRNSRSELCSSEFLGKINAFESSDATRSVLMLADVIMPLVGGVSGVYLSMLMMKLGLNRLCDSCVVDD